MWDKQALEKALRDGTTQPVLLQTETRDGIQRLFWALQRRRRRLALPVALRKTGAGVMITPTAQQVVIPVPI